MKPIDVHPEAEAEGDAAFEWYWVRNRPGALRFDSELRTAFSNLRNLRKDVRLICAERDEYC
jgi:hypothetical protein